MAVQVFSFSGKRSEWTSSHQWNWCQRVPGMLHRQAIFRKWPKDDFSKMRKVVPLSPACQVVSGPFEPVAFDVDGYQGDFPDKLFCKLSRRRKYKNEQSAITLPCLPVFFAQCDLCPTWVQVRINFCSNWAEVEFGTSAQFGWRCTGFLFPTWE